jgi:hypothetical protein
LLLFSRYYKRDEIEDDEIDGNIVYTRDDKCISFIGKPEGKKPLWRRTDG